MLPTGARCRRLPVRTSVPVERSPSCACRTLALSSLLCSRARLICAPLSSVVPLCRLALPPLLSPLRVRLHRGPPLRQPQFATGCVDSNFMALVPDFIERARALTVESTAGGGSIYSAPPAAVPQTDSAPLPHGAVQPAAASSPAAAAAHDAPPPMPQATCVPTLAIGAAAHQAVGESGGRGGSGGHVTSNRPPVPPYAPAAAGAAPRDGRWVGGSARSHLSTTTVSVLPSARPEASARSAAWPLAPGPASARSTAGTSAAPRCRMAACECSMPSASLADWMASLSQTAPPPAAAVDVTATGRKAAGPACVTVKAAAPHGLRGLRCDARPVAVSATTVKRFFAEEVRVGRFA